MLVRVILGIILFLLSAFWAWRDLRGALFLLVAVLPLNHKEFFSLGAWNIIPARVVLVGILAGAALKLLLALGRHRADLKSELRTYFRDPVLLLLLSLWLVRLLSLFQSKNLLASVSLLVFFSAVIGLYIVLRWCRRRHGRAFLLTLLRFYIAVVLLSGVWSILQYLFWHLGDITLPGAVWPTEYQPLRVGSFFWDINHYAAYVVTAVPILGLLAAEKQAASGFGGARLSWLLFGFTLLVSGMTLSRSGWGALFLALPLAVVLAVFVKKGRRVGLVLGRVLGGVVVFAVLGSLFLGLPVLKRLDTFTDIHNSDSIKAHMSVLRGVWELFSQKPLLGVGYGSFPEHFRETKEAEYYFSKDPVHNVRVPAHSVWGEVLAETGVLGFLPFSALLILLLRGTFRHFRRIPTGWAYTLGGFCSILGLLFAGIFYSYNLVFFWFFIFLTYELAKSDTS